MYYRSLPEIYYGQYRFTLQYRSELLEYNRLGSHRVTIDIKYGYHTIDTYMICKDIYLCRPNSDHEDKYFHDMETDTLNHFINRTISDINDIMSIPLRDLPKYINCNNELQKRLIYLRFEKES